MRTIIAAAVALTAVSAHADWEKTRWGMMPDEVRATDPTLMPASRGMNRANLRAVWQGNYTAGDFAFRSDFQFDTENHLAMVALELIDLNLCRELNSTLQAKYGTPATAISTRTDWIDGKAANKVTLNSIPGVTCSVVYTKLDTEAMKGL